VIAREIQHFKNREILGWYAVNLLETICGEVQVGEMHKWHLTDRGEKGICQLISGECEIPQNWERHEEVQILELVACRIKH
jgi:hypothetical protein